MRTGRLVLACFLIYKTCRVSPQAFCCPRPPLLPDLRIYFVTIILINKNNDNNNKDGGRSNVIVVGEQERRRAAGNVLYLLGEASGGGCGASPSSSKTLTSGHSLRSIPAFHPRFSLESGMFFFFYLSFYNVIQCQIRFSLLIIIVSYVYNI